jgi:hypothetical protein
MRGLHLLASFRLSSRDFLRCLNVPGATRTQWSCQAPRLRKSVARLPRRATSSFDCFALSRYRPRLVSR